MKQFMLLAIGVPQNEIAVGKQRRTLNSPRRTKSLTGICGGCRVRVSGFEGEGREACANCGLR